MTRPDVVTELSEAKAVAEVREEATV